MYKFEETLFKWEMHNTVQMQQRSVKMTTVNNWFQTNLPQLEHISIKLWETRMKLFVILKW